MLTWKLPTPIMRLIAADKGVGGGALSITIPSLPRKSCKRTHTHTLYDTLCLSEMSHSCVFRGWILIKVNTQHLQP